MLKLSFLVTFIVLISSYRSFAQQCIKGKVIESETGMPVVFASVIFQTQTAQNFVITDVYGKFEICHEHLKTITVSCVGYKPQQVILTGNSDASVLVVHLENNTVTINEVTITPTVNPAIRIMREVLRNKDKNNYLNYPKYKYSCYFKTTYDIKLASNATVSDSATLQKNRYLSRQAMFITESFVTCTSINHLSEGHIIATRTSGF